MLVSESPLMCAHSYTITNTEDRESRMKDTLIGRSIEAYVGITIVLPLLCMCIIFHVSSSQIAFIIQCTKTTNEHVYVYNEQKKKTNERGLEKREKIEGQ